MSLLKELNRLQELPPPPLPSLWPHTWGWWLLLALLLSLSLLAFTVWLRHRQANAYRWAALDRLEQLLEDWQQVPTDTTPLREIPGVLKQAVLARLGPGASDIAATSGQDWQQVLARMARSPLPDDFAQQLAILAYADDRAIRRLDLARLIACCQAWLETHDDPV